MPRPIHLFIPCYVDQYFPQVAMAMVNILRDLDCQPIFLEEQTCCGQPAGNSGYAAECAVMAERFLKIFEDAETIVAPSGSCVSQVKKHYEHLKLSDSGFERHAKIQSRIFELSQFLVDELGIETWNGQYDATVTYHDACHGLRELGIFEQPRKLLRSIDGLSLEEMKRSDTCCGFGGTFSVKFAEISTAMAENKTEWIRESGASVLVSGDSSCLMHLSGYSKRQGGSTKMLHLAEVLWQARQNR
ncbi:MAG: (Fe-S)-binding protein [Calditrichia bacterium]